MGSGIQTRPRKRRFVPEAGDLAIYSSTEQQCVPDHRSSMNSFKRRVADETKTAVTMTIDPEKVNLYSRAQKRSMKDHGLDTTVPGKKMRTAQTSNDSICSTYGHSDYSKTTTETFNCSRGKGVCIEDSLTKPSSTESGSTSRITATSIKPQREEIHTNLINLPDDLIREVLGKLRPKDIVRLGSLNKSWRSELHRIRYDEGYIFSPYHSILQANLRTGILFDPALPKRLRASTL